MSGVGAYIAGGRWNSPARYAVYTSGNLSLAMLEMLVHIDDAETFRATPHVYHSVSFPESAVATLQQSDLPVGWDSRPESAASQVVGDEWLDSLVRPVLAVPSVIVPAELRLDPAYLTYVINPLHPDFPTLIAIGLVHDLMWDVRLTRTP
jgi:RES domain-containing protein